MVRHLILRLEAPLISFGGEAIDNYGVVRDFPSASMLTGLIANALGYRRGDAESLDRLQARLVFATRLDHVAERMQDFQTVHLGKSDKGWTTRGRPEGRAGGAGTYSGAHLRYRDYDADACICVALRLEPPDHIPTLSDIANALDEPLRPLFIGRKPCLPSSRMVDGFVEAETTLAALRAYPRLTDSKDEREVTVYWPADEGDLRRARLLTVTDRRNWRSGVHGGARQIKTAKIVLPARASVEVSV